MKRMDNQQLLIAGLGIVLLGGMAAFRYLPIVRQKLDTKDRILQYTLSTEQIQHYAAVLPELQQKKEQLETRLADYSAIIPEGKQFARLWQQIADVMNDCKLTGQLVQPGPEQRSEQLCCIPLTLECSGTLDQVFSFFQAMERLDRLVSLDAVELKNSPDFDATVKLNATANVYYQPVTAENGSF